MVQVHWLSPALPAGFFGSRRARSRFFTRAALLATVGGLILIAHRDATSSGDPSRGSEMIVAQAKAAASQAVASPAEAQATPQTIPAPPVASALPEGASVGETAAQAAGPDRRIEEAAPQPAAPERVSLAAAMPVPAAPESGPAELAALAPSATAPPAGTPPLVQPGLSDTLIVPLPKAAAVSDPQPLPPGPGPALATAVAEPVTAPQEPIAGSVPPLEVWQFAAVTEVDRPPAATGSAVLAPITERPVRPAPARPKPAPVLEATPLPPKPQPREFSSALLGKWVPHTEACTNADGTEYLPLHLARGHATAGDGTCAFVSKKPNGSGWSVVAECTDGANTWTSSVNLKVARGQLTWESERGTQSYVRCPQPTVVAKAPSKARYAVKKPRGKVARAPKPKAAGIRVVTGPGGTGNGGPAVLRIP